jgi:hypothetical protein
MAMQILNGTNEPALFLLVGDKHLVTLHVSGVFVVLKKTVTHLQNRSQRQVHLGM